VTPINVAEPALLKKFNGQLTAVPLDEWKVWLRWRVLKISAPYLSTPIAAEELHFSGTVLNGVQEARPRWQTCVNAVDRDLSDVLGQAYVEKYFPPEAKRRMLLLVENLREAMRDEIEQVAWMTPATKKNAVTKLNALKVNVGYPDRWRDYSALAVSRNTYFENVRSAWTAGQRYEIAKIGKPVDRSDWSMTPPTVNANSNASRVEITFPAGILQPPFFDPKADDAVNYGGIGVVIGHEITHGFDDRGRRFDARGNLTDWWTAEDARRYVERASRVERQYGGYVGVDEIHVNGKLTLGENISDVGGTKIAYLALQRSMAGKPREAVDGLSPEQRFFLSFAQIWRARSREENERLQLRTDGHSPPRFRVAGVIANLPEFSTAYSCSAGKPLLSESDRANIW
jgi:predicted metalloendopeptidase